MPRCLLSRGARHVLQPVALVPMGRYGECDRADHYDYRPCTNLPRHERSRCPPITRARAMIDHVARTTCAGLTLTDLVLGCFASRGRTNVRHTWARRRRWTRRRPRRRRRRRRRRTRPHRKRKRRVGVERVASWARPWERRPWPGSWLNTQRERGGGGGVGGLACAKASAAGDDRRMWPCQPPA